MYIQCFHSERIRQRSRLRWRKGEVYPRWDTQKRVSFWINKANTGSNVSLTARGNCASNCLNIKRSCTRPMAFPSANVCAKLRLRALAWTARYSNVDCFPRSQPKHSNKENGFTGSPFADFSRWSIFELRNVRLRRYSTFLFLTMTMIETNRGESKDKLEKMAIRYICNFLWV